MWKDVFSIIFVFFWGDIPLVGLLYGLGGGWEGHYKFVE
jgi:hypothetical protein